MKNIESYIDEKYSSEAYSEIEKGIYKCGDNTVTSLCFEQEPELDEGKDSTDISQYPSVLGVVMLWLHKQDQSLKKLTEQCIDQIIGINHGEEGEKEDAR